MEADWYFHMFYSVDWNFYCWTTYGRIFCLQGRFVVHSYSINMRNHVKLGVSPRILYGVVDTGYGLGGSLGDCRPSLPKGRKYQMVKTQTESHDRRPIV